MFWLAQYKYNIQSEEFKFPVIQLFKPGIGRKCFNVDGAEQFK
jgi:hypothetical protein